MGGGLENLSFLLGFCFPLIGIGYSGVVLFKFFLFCIFLSMMSMVLVQMFFFLIILLHSGYFSNPDKVGKVLRYLFV